MIDENCDPALVIHDAAIEAVDLCESHYGISPPVDVVDRYGGFLPFIPLYLHYIIFEVLKNSLRATVEACSEELNSTTAPELLEERLQQRPVQILVSGNDSHLMVRVSDQGSGIHLKDMEKIWAYLYTTAKKQLSPQYELAEDDESPTPMAGFGCGLPLARSYAKYAGGDLEILSIPKYGTDAYLLLNRLGDHEEAVPRHEEVFEPPHLDAPGGQYGLGNL